MRQLDLETAILGFTYMSWFSSGVHFPHSSVISSQKLQLKYKPSYFVGPYLLGLVGCWFFFHIFLPFRSRNCFWGSLILNLGLRNQYRGVLHRVRKLLSRDFCPWVPLLNYSKHLYLNPCAFCLGCISFPYPDQLQGLFLPPDTTMPPNTV